MSSSQKEEGTSHYRSGIFDVVSVPAKKADRRPAQNVIVREDYGDLREIMSRLSMNVEENTRAIRALHNYLGADRSMKHRQDRIQVFLRVAFLRIIDIDTKDQTFTAEVFLQASWYEPVLKSASQNDIDNLDYNGIWTPCVHITNLVGQPAQKKEWFGGYRQQGQKYPLLYMRSVVRAKFRENLYLKEFPVDYQTLSVCIASDRTSAEIGFAEDLATVNMNSFQDQSEFTLHPHVEVRSISGEAQGLDSYDRSPKLNFSCHVTRRPGHYFWNVFLILFLISGLLFVDYIIAVNAPLDRLKVSLTLLLIVVAYNLVISKEVPKFPYISYMGGYVLANILFLVWQSIQNAIIAMLASSHGMAYANEADRYFFAVMVFLYLTFNVVYIIFLVVKYFLTQKSMTSKNDAYKDRLRNNSSYREYDTPYEKTYSGRTYENAYYNSNDTSSEHVSTKKKHRKHRNASVDFEPEQPGGEYTITAKEYKGADQSGRIYVDDSNA